MTRVPNSEAAPLGASEVVLVDRVRLRHGEFADGARQTFVGCSVQPQSSSESDQGLTTDSRWTIFVPGGDFPEQTDNVVLWNGYELSVDGRLQTWFDDLSGESLYVTGRLRMWEA
jgi:hypothetical protein